MSTQTTGKTVFLLLSMVGWLLAGGALIYLSPYLWNLLLPSDTTRLWLTNLGRGGYNPELALTGGGAVLVLTVVGNAVWYRYFDGRSSGSS